MTQVTEAIYSQGMLKPLEQLDLADQQRVRLIVQSLEEETLVSREEAIERLRKGIQLMDFHSQGQLPSRPDLYDRD